MKRRWRAILAGAVAILGSAAILLVVMNKPEGWPFNWDAYKAIAAQPPDARAEGRVGVLVVALIQPEQFDTAFYINFVDKLLKLTVPWPINLLAARDKGVALIDPDNPDQLAEFPPKTLMAFDGRTVDWDGEPYADKYRRGLIEWVPPSTSTAGDIGTFRYAGRSGGAPWPAQKAMLKARAIYYARLPGGRLPQRAQTLAMVEAAFAQLKANRAVTATALYDIFLPHKANRELIRLLDSGIDSLVIASALPIHSDFEEYQGAYPKIYKVIKEWAEKRGQPMPKLVFARQMADMPGYAMIWAKHLAETAPAPARPDASATLVVSLHGLPVAQEAKDRWRENARRAAKQIAPVLTAALKRRGWRKVTTVVAQEAFADDEDDPADKLVSVSEVFAKARARGDALAIAVPIEFLAENTDTIFLHSYLMFDGLPGYQRFAAPPADTDWAKPYVRRYRMGPTTHMYIGTPGGDVQPALGKVLADAIAERLPK
jgi:hypothetical protein